jgi:glycosyltransferase involved in cell wall biosynthesis
MTDFEHILLISTSSGSRGGGEIYLQSLAAGLDARGRAVSVLLSDHPRMDELARGFPSGVNVVRKPYQNTYDKRFRILSEVWGAGRIAPLQECLDELSPGLVHLNKQNLEDGLDWLRAIDRSGVPSVTTIHVTNRMADLGARFGAARDRLVRGLLRRIDPHVIAVSHASRAHYERFLGERRRSRVSTIPNGVPDASQTDRAALRKDFRSQWNISEESFVLGTVARIEEQKNPFFAVRLLARLPARVHLVWVGDGRLRVPMERLAAELGVTPRLHIDGWRHDARERMAAFDLFLLPSRYEGFPLAILEAMSAELPSVVSEVDGNAESVLHGQTGLVLPPESLPDWERELASLIAAPGRLREMGAAARQRYREEYSLDAMTEQTLACYARIIQGEHCS